MSNGVFLSADSIAVEVDFRVKVLQAPGNTAGDGAGLVPADCPGSEVVFQRAQGVVCGQEEELKWRRSSGLTGVNEVDNVAVTGGLQREEIAFILPSSPTNNSGH